MDLIISILWLLIYVAILVGVVHLVFWALGRLGISVPGQVMNVVWVIVVLLVLVWVLQAFVGGGMMLPHF